MTLDEHIKKAEQDAVQAESDSDWGFGNFFIDRTEAIAYAKECRQLAEWLKELKQIRNALDMIRAELTEEKESYEKVGNWKKAYGFEKSIEIIDRYKGGQK